jgi:glucose/arabinose dehydrogenase
MRRPTVRHPWRVLAAILAGSLVGSVLITPAAWGVVRTRRVVRCRPAVPLCVPTAFAFGPRGGQIFYTEKDTGQIRVRNLRTGKDTVWTRIPDVATEGSKGLLGLALDPTWLQGPEHRWVYAYYTDNGMEDPGTPGEDTPDRNVIVRMRKLGGILEQEELLEIAGAAVPHNGGVLRFGPDRKLYAAVGDGNVNARAQDLADPAGKVLRMNSDGSVPADNPFAGDPAPGGLVYSFGHRNSFGFTFDPRTERLWETENGPECNDEINLVIPGANFAWGPDALCGSLPTPHDTNRDGPSPRMLPKRTFLEPVTVTGATFCAGCGLGRRTRGDLLVASYRLGQIWAFNLNASRTALIGRRSVFQGDVKPIALQTGPNGRIYFSDLTGIRVLIGP